MIVSIQYFERKRADRMRASENGAEKPAFFTNGSPAGQELDYNRIIEIHLMKISFCQHERLVPYIFHYYTLENGVQKMAGQYAALM